MPEVDIPTRFFFFYTGPIESEDDQIYSNIGVSLAVALTDKDFAHEVQTSQASLDISISKRNLLPLDNFSTHLSFFYVIIDKNYQKDPYQHSRIAKL